MNYKRLTYLFLIGGVLLPASCRTKTVLRPKEPVPLATNETAPSKEALVPADALTVPSTDVTWSSVTTHTLFFQPHPEADAKYLVETLKTNPRLKLTLIFPADFFKAQTDPAVMDAFHVLLSSDQIEIALTLSNEPILPLLGNLKLAGPDVVSWGFNYAWPSDIAQQIAKGSGEYQTRWGRLPLGFYPPYLSLSPQVLEALKRFRLHWIMGKPNASWGVNFLDESVIFVPEPPPSIDLFGENSSVGMAQLIKMVSSKPFTFIDASQWVDPGLQTEFLKKLSQAIKANPVELVTGADLAGVVGSEVSMASRDVMFENDFQPWIQTDKQRKAWASLAHARDVIETYKNSGRANLKRLDAAMEELMTAQSGPFLMALGQTAVPLTLNERNFIATVENIYRLCNVPVPEGINKTFSTMPWEKMKQSHPTQFRAKPFFYEENNRFVWNDPEEDDLGWGGATYPLGSYPKNSFDLREFAMSWGEDEVTFSAQFGDLPRKDKNLICPLIDIYLDVNAQAGAGNTNPLKNRGPCFIAAEAAWEYVITAGPYAGGLYQSIPGQEPRSTFKIIPTVDEVSKQISFSIPRARFRGDPMNWRLTVLVMGCETTRTGQSENPIPILSNAGLKNFGGAPAGTKPLPFIDLLSPTVEDQSMILSDFEQNKIPTLPFVRAE